MLSFDQFKDYVEENLKSCLPKNLQDAEIRINTVTKNNGTELTGVVIMPEGLNIAPTIYLEPLYTRYEDGESLNSILNHIVRTNEVYQIKAEKDFDITRDIFDFDKVKDKVIAVLVNGERNQEMLANVPYTRHEDLAMIYKILMTLPGSAGEGTVTVNNDIMTMWDMDVNELDAIAVENSRRMMPGICQSMTQVMTEMLKEQNVPEEMLVDMIPSEEDNGMYVITNPARTNGASVMIYSDVLQELSQKLGENLYILPSSTHEVLAVPESMGDVEMLAEMVQSINEAEVAPDEQLSDHVYFYDAAKRSITLADTSVEELGLVSDKHMQYGSTPNEGQSAGGRRGGHR